MLLDDACHSIDSPNMPAILENVKFLNHSRAPPRIRFWLQWDRARSTAMSRHSTSFKAEAEVPAEAVQELLPQPNPVAQSAAPAASEPSYKNRIRRLLMAGSAVALLAASAWYGWDYWTVGRFLVSTDDAYVKADNTTIAPKVSGYLVDVLVGDNERVKAGQVLARIDDRDFKVALDQEGRCRSSASDHRKQAGAA
jgi:biotin carboxyl carrier protein